MKKIIKKIHPITSKSIFYAFLLLIFIANFAVAQNNPNNPSNPNNPKDSTNENILEGVSVEGVLPSPERLNEVEGTFIFAGKKNEVIRLSGINANLVNNSARQVFSRIPGVSIWENDGSGVQISIGTRGLSPNRSWEFNTRQNGYDISADVFGYPEAYYNPPLEAVEKVQVVRGAATLQFGAQFGGAVNYILKREKQNKPFTFETQNAVGSYGLFSTYNAIGGNTKKWSYNAYNHSRKGNGWRENGQYEVRNTHFFVEHKFNVKTSISAEYTNMDYVVQQSGGLIDAKFDQDSRQSNRKRNWTGISWNLANINLDYKANNNFSLNMKIFGLFAQRTNLGFIAKANLNDTINTTLGSYNNRQIDTDLYKNVGMELRGIYAYSLFNQKENIKQNLAFGVRVYEANTIRRQKGKADAEFGYNTNLLTEKYPTDYQFKTKNVAVFVENLFRMNKKFSITQGIRFEHINSFAEGRANIVAGNDVNIAPQNVVRNIVLAGIGLEYKFQNTNIYANLSQAYRPVLFGDIVPPTTTDVIDANLKDASGFNADLGYRGSFTDYFNFDVSLFYLNYDNRIGTIRKFLNDDITKNTYQFRTNLGQSVNMGLEAYLELSLLKPFMKNNLQNNKIGDLSIFTSLAFINAEYKDFKTTTITGTAPNISIKEDNLKGKRVENAPKQIHNFGLTYTLKNFSATAQTRITSDVFADASNTETPTNDGIAGKVAGYSVYDFSFGYRFLEKYNLKGGINNLTDTKYATRRTGGNGGGLISGEGRTFYISVGAKF